MSEIQGIDALGVDAGRGYAPNALAGLSAAGLPSATTIPPGAPSFSQLVTSGVAEVNRQLLGSQQDLQALAMGDIQNLHQVMIRLEESKLTFQLMMQVRNRLLESYQDIMKMPV
jgi:flagellar hook-basal body complex protein FliE